MSTLAEIEAAAESLAPDEQQELLLFLAARLQVAGVALTSPHQIPTGQISSNLDDAAPIPYFRRRNLLPEFARLQAAGAFRPKPGDRDITDLISDDRDGR
jgi:hypothetical protein